MAFSEGQMLGPYQIIAPMGQGGMATIYKAYHARLDRTVAIKMMHQAFLEDQNFLSRFEREAQIVAKLEHPNIVPVYDFADYEGQPYLVMKYIEGQTLKALNDRAGLSADDVLRVMQPIADALDYAHRQGVLHRDIKPSNIILGTDGTIYLTDFGLARLAQLGQSTLSTDLLVGTPNYISPEQAMGTKDIDSRTDLYSLGVVLYELVVGRVPFSADTPFAVIHDHIYTPLPAPSSINPNINPEVEAVLVKALSKKPAERYNTATEMIAAFRHAADSQTQGAKPSERETLLIDAQEMKRVSAPPRPTPEYRDRFDDEQVVAEKPKRDNRRVEASWDLSDPGKAFGQVRNLVENGIALISGQDDELASPDDENAMRSRVEKQYKKRTEFTGHLIAFVLVNALLLLIFFFTGNVLPNFFDFNPQFIGFPWPLIVLLGWGAGLAAHAVETYYQTGERAARRLRAIHGEFERIYGDRWYKDATKAELRKVRSRVAQPFTKRREFFDHLAVFIPINIMLWMIFLFTGDFLSGDSGSLGFPWPLIVVFGWGIGLVFHGVEMLSYTTRQHAIDQAVERERDRYYDEKPKRDQFYDESEPRVRLKEDGEFTDSMIQEIDAERKRRQ